MVRSRSDSPSARFLRRAAARSERGVAMLMVIVALTVTAVLTGAILGGREHAPMIGANATKLSKAKWGAEGAANVAVAAMGQIADMMDTLADPAVPLEDLQIGDAHVKVMLTDLEGNPPEDDDRELIMWAYAEIDGMIREVKKRISIREGGSAADALDLELKDFVIFAQDSIYFWYDSSLAPWALSPEAGSPERPKIGVGYDNNSNTAIDAGPGLAPIAYRADDDAKNSVLNALSSLSPGHFWQIPLDVPAIAEAPVPALLGLLGGGSDAQFNLGDTVSLPPGSYGQLVVQNGAMVTLDAGAGGMYGFREIWIDGGGTLIVSGQAEVIVEQFVDLRNSGAFVLADDAATLRLHVLDDLLVDRGSFGTLVSDATMRPEDVQQYVDPTRVSVYAPGAFSGGTGHQRMVFSNQSAVVAHIHAPYAAVQVNSNAALMGRVTASHVELGPLGRLWYCPTLDSGLGFATPDGPLYDETTGDPIAGLEDALESIDGIPGTLADLYAIMYAGWTPPGGTSGGGVDVRDLPGDAIPEDDGGFELVSPLGESTIGP